MTARREGHTRRRRIAPAVVSLLWVLALPPAPAEAQARAVRLETPRCPTLPFDAARLRALLALELSVHGVTLREGGDADVVIAYEPVPCAPGATRYRLEVRDGDARVREDEADMAEVPLGTVPRALALEIVETVRGLGAPPPSTSADASSADASSADASSADASSDDASSADASSADASSADASSVEASADASTAGPPMTDMPSGSGPAAGADPAVADPAAPEPSSAPGHPVRFVLLAHLRNSPDTGAVLAGPRLGLDLPLGDGLPLALRLDAALAFGPSAAGVVVGAIDGGVTLSFWARAAEVLALRFGPRLWVGHAFAVAGGEGATRRSEDVQVGLGVRVAAELGLSDGLDVLVEAEVGTNLHGLDLEVGGERSGFLGAYWGVDVGLGFH